MRGAPKAPISPGDRKGATVRLGRGGGVRSLGFLGSALEAVARSIARRAAENLAGIAATMLALVLALFELERDVPRLAERAPEPALADRATALRLLEAPRKSPQAFAWFARAYPGSIALYLAWSWLGGFPANASGALPGLRASFAAFASRRARTRSSSRESAGR
jgi:hypothetical protein